MVKSWLVTIILLSLFIGCNNKTEESPGTPGKVIRGIDSLKLSDLSGQTFNLEKLRGKTVFINFWATWCKPCINEMPSIIEAQKILGKEKVIFLLASGEGADQINEFVNANNFKSNFIRIENSEEMRIQALPATFIFNKKGNLVFSETGSRKWNEKNNIDLILKIENEND